jgi:Protein of unknown function (DUF3352)
MDTALSAPQRDPGLRRAIIGGLGVTLASMVFGLVAFAWLFLAQRTEGIPQLLGSDTQLYVALKPNLREAPNIARLQAAFPALFDDTAPSPVGVQIDSLLDVDFSSEVAPWIGAEMALAVSGLNADISPLSREELAERATVLFIFASRDDPTALRFLEAHRAKREAAGQRFTTAQVGESTLYTQEGAAASPIGSFGLVRHYVVFTNRPEALLAFAEQDPEATDTLQASPRFQGAQSGLPTQRVGYLYLDSAALAGLAKQAPMLDGLEVLALTINLVADGVQIDTLAAAQGGSLDSAAFAPRGETRYVDLLSLSLPSGLDQQVSAALQSLALAEQPTSASGLSRGRLVLQIGQ